MKVSSTRRRSFPTSYADGGAARVLQDSPQVSVMHGCPRVVIRATMHPEDGVPMRGPRTPHSAREPLEAHRDPIRRNARKVNRLL
jgi:hypothetical protein